MTEAPTRLRKSERLTVSLLVAQVLLAIAAVVLTRFQGMRSAACDTQCDFEAADAALVGISITAPAILIVTVLVLFFLRKRNWSSAWLVPLAGVLLTVLAMVFWNQVFISALPV